MNMKKYTIGVIVLLMSVLLWGCGQEQEETENKAEGVSEPTAQIQQIDISKPTIYTQLQEEEAFESFVSMIKKAKMEYWLNEEQGITIFVPTNEAISPLLQDKAILNKIISEPNFIVQMVKNHVIPRAIDSEELKKIEQMYNTNEQLLGVSQVGSNILLEGMIEVSNKAVEAENGFIYSVNGVLLPE